MIHEFPLVPNVPFSSLLYLSVVAYPGFGTEAHAQREKWVTAVVGATQKGRGHHSPAGFRRKRSGALEVVNRGYRRIIQRRVPAVWLAERRLAPPSEDGLPATKAYWALLDRIPAEFGMQDVDAVKRLCWRESLPALAMAIPVVGLVLDGKGQPSLARLAALTFDPNWVLAAIETSRIVAPMLIETFQPADLFLPTAVTETRMHEIVRSFTPQILAKQPMSEPGSSER